MAVKATVSDFEDKYKAYFVVTRNGAAYKGPNYGRAVDIGGDVSYALTTGEAQALYGDTVALQVRNRQEGREWPADVQLIKAPVRLVSLSLSFNQVSRLMAEARAAENPRDKVAEAFDAAVRKHHLQPLGQFFIIPSRVLPERTNENESVRDATLDETGRFIEKKPQNIIVTADSAAELLSGTHDFCLLIEKQKPGFTAENRFFLTGLYMGYAEPGERVVNTLPVPAQDRVPISQVTSELRRLLGPP